MWPKTKLKSCPWTITLSPFDSLDASHLPYAVGEMHPCFPVLQVWWLDKTISASIFWFFLHSLQLYLGVFLTVISIPLFKLPSFALFSLHCTKNCEFFNVFFTIYSSPLQRSNLIELSSFDLEVSQASFSVKVKNSTLLDGRLHCYSCIDLN